MQYGCIGEKLSHSFSKIIHNELCDYDYQLKELSRDELDSFMRTKDFDAINVTIPYKQDVISYLDEIDGMAKEIGAVNTIVNKNGKLFGFNTDFSGMKALLVKTGIDPHGKKVLILGSGGTSKTANAVSSAMGAREVYRVSRNANDGAITYDEAYKNHADAEIIINTTPCGMYPNIKGAAIDIDRFSKLEGVIDAVYNPLRSELVSRALQKGIPASGGLYMLVAQAVFAAEHFTGKKFDSFDIDRVYGTIMKDKENIVLIGMPASGKSTLGKMIANRLGKEFIDSDEVIKQRENCSIPDIFKRGGEAEFRSIESKVIYDLSLTGGKVIATGGGAVLDSQNVRYLKQNGRLIFINRPIDSIPVTDDRPLSNDRLKLQNLYKTRLPIYRNAKDIEIAADGSIEQNALKIMEAL